MKRIFLILILSVLSIFSFADEGMWVISFISRNYPKMKALGYKLTPEDIYSINHSSMKDAVIALDGGSCTGEIISPYGLVLTNHHCGYNEIQAHSTVEHDYLKNGFWASSYNEELPNPGKEAWFLVKVEDVSKKILKKLKKVPSSMRRDALKQIISELENQAKKKYPNYTIEIKSFYDGNQYLMFYYLVYKDVRLVGAPPENIGKFGGDTDNWMWPRHTGDFSLFRIYAAPDGSPAEYSPDNVPLKTPAYFKLNISGVKEGDFAMIIGYPGSTSRYLTSWEVEEVRDVENAIRIKVREKKLNILKSFMDKDPAIRIKYAAKYAQSSNYYKYSIGQNLGFKRLKVIQRKLQLQKEMQQWINKSKKRQKIYGQIFENISKAVKYRRRYENYLNYWFEAIYLGSEVLQLGYHALISETNEEFVKEMEKFYRDFDINVDKELFRNLFQLYLDNVDAMFYPDMYKTQCGMDISRLIDTIYSSKFFQADALQKIKEEGLRFLDFDDPVFEFTKQMLRIYFDIKDKIDDINDKNNFDESRRLYMDAYMKLAKSKNKDTLIYPDANSTMRLTYGKVKSYSWEGKKYNYFTTIDEYVEKGKKYKDNPEFEMNKKMVELYEKKDFGRYADKSDGTLHLCFITDNDITGGNSGSPVINGEGQLIGVAFDGNWEAMSGDIIFEPPVQRTICVDIRYVLFVIDKVANAQNIMKEITIVQ